MMSFYSNGVPINETRCFSAKEDDAENSTIFDETLSVFEGNLIRAINNLECARFPGPPLY